MRDFVRGCLIWLVGYPLSAVAASAVLSAVVWTTPGIDLRHIIQTILGVTPFVAFLALFPAALTPASSRVWDFVAAGTRTGGGFGLLVTSPYFLAFLTMIFHEARGAMIGGASARSGNGEIVWALLMTTVLLSLFTVAGAVGGFVFGLFAAERREAS